MASLVLPAAAFGQAAGAQPAAGAAKREAASRPATGSAVIEYEESRGSAIVYLEEAGALVAPFAPAVVPRREAAASPAKASAAAPTAAAPATGVTRAPRLVTRQVADAEGVAAKR